MGGYMLIYHHRVFQKGQIWLPIPLGLYYIISVWYTCISVVIHSSAYYIDVQYDANLLILQCMPWKIFRYTNILIEIRLGKIFLFCIHNIGCLPSRTAWMHVSFWPGTTCNGSARHMRLKSWHLLQPITNLSFVYILFVEISYQARFCLQISYPAIVFTMLMGFLNRGNFIIHLWSASALK